MIKMKMLANRDPLLFISLCFLVLMMSCGTVRINYDYDSKADFNKYKTYNYYSDLETGFNPFDTERLMSALDDGLEAKGLSLSADPDFYINISSEAVESFQRNNVGVGIGGTGRNVGGGVTVGLPLNNNNSIQLVIDFNDESGKGLFWQAVGQFRFNENSGPEVKEQIIRQVISKILEEYPPDN